MNRAELMKMLDQLEDILIRVETDKKTSGKDILASLRACYKLTREVADLKEKLERLETRV